MSDMIKEEVVLRENRRAVSKFLRPWTGAALDERS
jgi:hypothetical protein